VRLIDETGENVGVVKTEEALRMARQKELDLIEVSPKADPPVARIHDYNKLRYQESKERKKMKARQKKVEIKGLRLSFKMGQGDMDIRKKQALKFLNENDKVKIEMNLRGRERQHKRLAIEKIEQLIQSINEEIPVRKEQNVQAQGGRLSTVIAKQS